MPFLVDKIEPIQQACDVLPTLLLKLVNRKTTMKELQIKSCGVLGH